MKKERRMPMETRYHDQAVFSTPSFEALRKFLEDHGRAREPIALTRIRPAPLTKTGPSVRSMWRCKSRGW
jgi:hypothetical protein